jgi:hypothetical protein
MGKYLQKKEEKLLVSEVLSRRGVGKILICVLILALAGYGIFITIQWIEAEKRYSELKDEKANSPWTIDDLKSIEELEALEPETAATTQPAKATPLVRPRRTLADLKPIEEIKAWQPPVTPSHGGIDKQLLKEIEQRLGIYWDEETKQYYDISERKAVYVELPSRYETYNSEPEEDATVMSTEEAMIMSHILPNHTTQHRTSTYELSESKTVFTLPRSTLTYELPETETILTVPQKIKTNALPAFDWQPHQSSGGGLNINGYGLGVHSNRFGQPVKLWPDFGGVPGEFLQIGENTYGPSIHSDQYGRPVREYPWP